VCEGQQVIKFGIIIKCCYKNQTVTTEVHIMFSVSVQRNASEGKFALTNVSENRANNVIISLSLLYGVDSGL